MLDAFSFVRQIESNGFCYVTDDGVYFDTIAFGDRYGKLAPPAALKSQSMDMKASDYQPPPNAPGKKVCNFDV